MTPAKPQARNRVVVENLIWFVASLIMACVVWLIAVTQLDPVEQWQLREAIPIEIVPEPGLLITNGASLTNFATARLRAQRSVRELVSTSDVRIWADLTGLSEGSHVVELQWEVLPERNVRVLDISPRQVTVVLEQEQSILVQVQITLEGELPAGYTVLDAPVSDISQVTVTGPASLVSQVAAAQATLDIGGQRATLDDDVRLTPVDADGNPVDGLSVDTQIIRARVPIGRSNSP